MSDARCPKCRADLAKKRAEKVKVLGCQGCRGVWIDLEEHGKELGDLAPFWAALTESGRDTALDCPFCANERLRVVKFGGCRLDACATCHGIWFDDGELDKVRTGRSKKGWTQEILEVSGLVVGECICAVVEGAIRAVGDAL